VTEYNLRYLANTSSTLYNRVYIDIGKSNTQLTNYDMVSSPKNLNSQAK